MALLATLPSFHLHTPHKPSSPGQSAVANLGPAHRGGWAWTGHLKMEMVGPSFVLKTPQNPGSPGRQGWVGERQGDVGMGEEPLCKHPPPPPPPTCQFQRFHRYREALCSKALSNCFKNKTIPEGVNTPYYWPLLSCEQVCKLL